MSRNKVRGTIAGMETDKEIEEIRRRIENLKNTDQISISEKIAVIKRALEIIDKSEEGKEVQ